MSQSVISNIIFKAQAILWFVLAIGLSVVWLFLWITTDVAQVNEKRQKEKITLADSPLPTYIESYVQLTKEVPPIDFATVIRDLRNYPSEFKDKSYFEKDAKRWTVQVMNVSSNDIIVEYLNQRDDRDKFAYFRYHNANDELRYILTYGSMASAQEALSAIKKVNFGLPSTAKVKAEEIGYYIKIMDQYERGDTLFGKEMLDKVNLMPAKREIAPSRLSAEQLRSGLDNKFQNATPASPNASSTPNFANAPSMANVPTSNAATGTPKSASTTNQTKKDVATNKPTPSETAESAQEMVIDMSIAPKAPTPQKPAVSSETSSSVTYTQNNDVTYEAPKSNARPNTNTNSIPGADRD
ncbi:hypothetical protein [Moraxella oblonga]|uniref:hypothetical protein n=1 Tax=Moraxella oblonga TaxID=200413 RepID=UPI00082CC4F0|nr:hypothetical protein [Moraxella oblonga]